MTYIHTGCYIDNMTDDEILKRLDSMFENNQKNMKDTEHKTLFDKPDITKMTNEEFRKYRDEKYGYLLK